jgi:hypothetical protein
VYKLGQVIDAQFTLTGSEANRASTDNQGTVCIYCHFFDRGYEIYHIWLSPLLFAAVLSDFPAMSDFLRQEAIIVPKMYLYYIIL